MIITCGALHARRDGVGAVVEGAAELRVGKVPETRFVERSLGFARSGSLLQYTTDRL